MNPGMLIEPGATLGVMGGGQLGRMFALAAAQLGYRVHVFAPEHDPPAAHVAARHWQHAYTDLDAVRQFAQSVSAITYEFENIPAEALFVAEKYVPVRPGGHVLQITQDRAREKGYLAASGFPVTPHRTVASVEELKAAVAELQLPVVLKTQAWGYDGKGQVRIDRPEDVPRAWARLGRVPAVCEQWIDFDTELSVVVARGLEGRMVAYGPLRNEHSRHILDTTVFPAGVPQSVADEALTIARCVAESLDVVGVLCVEYFLTAEGRLLINELAPRPHNSGHLTIDACITSQFEQQVRAMCGLPLGAADFRGGAAMANLLGDTWQQTPPDAAQLLRERDVHLHLYGKAEARTGRKMGHITALAETGAAALQRAVEARQSFEAARQQASPAPVSR